MQVVIALAAGMQEIDPQLGRATALQKIRRKWNNVDEASIAQASQGPYA